MGEEEGAAVDDEAHRREEDAPADDADHLSLMLSGELSRGKALGRAARQRVEQEFRELGNLRLLIW